MRSRKVTIDPAKIEFRTNQNKHYAESNVEDANRYTNDVDKAERIKQGKCKYCYYMATSMAGQVITVQLCGICDIDMTFGSTATDALCATCATEHKLCKKCGGDIDMNPFRKGRKLPK